MLELTLIVSFVAIAISTLRIDREISRIDANFYNQLLNI